MRIFCSRPNNNSGLDYDVRASAPMPGIYPIQSTHRWSGTAIGKGLGQGQLAFNVANNEVNDPANPGLTLPNVRTEIRISSTNSAATATIAVTENGQPKGLFTNANLTTPFQQPTKLAATVNVFEVFYV